MKKKYDVEQYKEAVVYDVQNGKRVEVRRFRFKLTETESMLLRSKKRTEKKLLKAKVALSNLIALLDKSGLSHEAVGKAKQTLEEL